eukprot:gnl/MRDRNA2_/MRDRNA2_200410_c0_seq1.p1 gnl/MRDRNA2_/MRDRNA2_200410_c0~~gnl/MRDRNA2_/MRDRNA2_200410_c0_seq1.p1  ORF type:complete len:518 (-),score=42.98 gnl/MRDRNA2_/MRDRNA2_200410_c0_seq1:102-1655(-)
MESDAAGEDGKRDVSPESLWPLPQSRAASHFAGRSFSGSAECPSWPPLPSLGSDFEPGKTVSSAAQPPLSFSAQKQQHSPAGLEKLLTLVQKMSGPHHEVDNLWPLKSRQSSSYHASPEASSTGLSSAGALDPNRGAPHTGGSEGWVRKSWQQHPDPPFSNSVEAWLHGMEQAVPHDACGTTISSNSSPMVRESDVPAWMRRDARSPGPSTSPPARSWEAAALRGKRQFPSAWEPSWSPHSEAALRSWNAAWNADLTSDLRWRRDPLYSKTFGSLADEIRFDKEIRAMSLNPAFRPWYMRYWDPPPELNVQPWHSDIHRDLYGMHSARSVGSTGFGIEPSSSPQEHWCSSPRPLTSLRRQQHRASSSSPRRSSGSSSPRRGSAREWEKDSRLACVHRWGIRRGSSRCESSSDCRSWRLLATPPLFNPQSARGSGTSSRRSRSAEFGSRHMPWEGQPWSPSSLATREGRVSAPQARAHPFTWDWPKVRSHPSTWEWPSAGYVGNQPLYVPQHRVPALR